MRNRNMSKLITEYCISNGLKKSSTQSITYMLQHYERFQEASLEELIIEAENEEDQGIRWKHRRLKRRLIAYTNHLQQTMMYSSAVVYLSTVKSFYRYFEIEIHNLPSLNKKNSKLPVPISFKDLPDKEIIRQSLEITTPLLQAIILFMASSGCSRKETLNLSIQDYLNSVEDYIHGMSFYEALRFLVQSEDVVPTFRLRRQKTNKYYYTFCTPEASQKIAYYLVIRCHQEYDVNSKLFDIGLHHMSTKFARINDHLGLGRKGTYNRFRPHMLRKFHASSLLNDGMSKDDVNSIQGKSKNRTDEAYFYDDPDKLKRKYITHMNAVIINSEINNIDIKSPEFIELEHKLEKKEAEVNEMNERLSVIEKMLFDIDQTPRSREEILKRISK